MPIRSILIASISVELSSKIEQLLSNEAGEPVPDLEIKVIDSAAATMAAVSQSRYLVAIVVGELDSPTTTSLLEATEPSSLPVIVLYPEDTTRDLLRKLAGSGAQDVICIDGLSSDLLWRRIEVVRTRWESNLASQRSDYGQRLKAIAELTDGLAHRINNPACYILANLSFLAEEIERIGTVVSGLTSTIGEDGAPLEDGMLPKLVTREKQMPGSGVALEKTLAEAREAIADSIQGTERICGVASELRKLLDEEQAALLRNPELDTQKRMRIRRSDLKPRARVLLIENERSASLAVGHLGRHEVVVVGSVGRAFETLANDRFFDAILCNGSSGDIDAVSFCSELATRDGNIVSRTILIGDASLRRQIENSRIPVVAEPIDADLLLAHVNAATALSGFSD